MSPTDAQPCDLEKCLPPSLTELFKAEMLIFKGGRPERLDYLKQGIDVESKFVKDWLAMSAPPPFDAKYTREQTEQAHKWFADLRNQRDVALANAKLEKTKIENELKLNASLLQRRKQKVEDEIAHLKELQKQCETLKKTLEQLSAEIKQATAAGLPDLIKELTDEKAKTEKSLTELDQQETQIGDDIKTAIDAWRNKRKELVEPKVNDLTKAAQQIDKLTKEIDYLKAYEDDIIAQYLLNPACCQKNA